MQITLVRHGRPKLSIPRRVAGRELRYWIHRYDQAGLDPEFPPRAYFNEFNRDIPTLLSISPNGPHGVIDLYEAGGMPAVMKVLADDLDLEARNVTGKTLREIVEEAEVFDESVIRPRDKPYLPEGGTVILFGNLAPEGAVVRSATIPR